MSELPEGTWLYVAEQTGGWYTLLNVHEGQNVAVGRVIDGGVADFICERMNASTPELAAARPDREGLATTFNVENPLVKVLQDGIAKSEELGKQLRALEDNHRLREVLAKFADCSNWFERNDYHTEEIWTGEGTPWEIAQRALEQGVNK